ncbi:hypothetical protein HF1_04380 [Mycoplasma haemofelis str. Langford 1]|uniref:Uncharacterized protein n=1 Tax=Mycoplasma haemofelis (strain Langford 1) TaxID=941640 RepID=E8ZH25_MYCHL|nr:hypothetical protein [Mycoplasma haemofelis]CBY92446.1 hypothetical protein HF1_04380 [Mycoplasma haemofelis str. Langford 1]
MAVSALYKGAALMGGAGSIVGGYFLANNLSSNQKPEKKVTSIEDRLRQEGYTPLNFKDTTGNDWNKIKTAYKAENTDNKRFTGIDKNNDNTLLKEISDSCVQYLKGDFNNEDNYKMSRRWCVVPISVQSKLQGRTFLKTETGDSSDDTHWDKIVKQHESGQNDKFTITTGSGNSTNNRDEIKKQCKEKSAFETTHADFEEALKKVDLWCTKESIKEGQ